MSERGDGSDKSRGIALALGGCLGLFGAHRYYVGKIGTGMLQTVTFGGLGLWWLYDMILVSFGAFTDSEGKRVKHWSEYEESGEHGGRNARLSGDAIEELYALRDEVAELAERVDFTERLLARGRDAPD
ncbi:MAG: NINE protein [Gemmatimonadetes bacterium]|nr:NINE protein [Gemmatimonadota bacterium]